MPIAAYANSTQKCPFFNMMRRDQVVPEHADSANRNNSIRPRTIASADSQADATQQLTTGIGIISVAMADVAAIIITMPSGSTS